MKLVTKVLLSHLNYQISENKNMKFILKENIVSLSIRKVLLDSLINVKYNYSNIII